MLKPQSELKKGSAPRCLPDKAHSLICDFGGYSNLWKQFESKKKLGARYILSCALRAMPRTKKDSTTSDLFLHRTVSEYYFVDFENPIRNSYNKGVEEKNRVVPQEPVWVGMEGRAVGVGERCRGREQSLENR